MLVDANILLYAVDEQSPVHRRAKEWIESALNGPSRVGAAVGVAHRIPPHRHQPRASRAPGEPAAAWAVVEAWLDAPSVWVPAPGRGHRGICSRLVQQLDLRGNLVSDGMLAALCIEHGLEMISADSDFARFSELTRHNPVAD